MNNQIKKLIALAFISSLVTACSTTPKPAPSWPSGQERPINKAPVVNDANQEYRG